MSEYMIQGDTLTGIADAIREKVGFSDLINPANMATLIQGIDSGGMGAEAVKAFVQAPVTNSIQVQKIAPVISFAEVESSYTDTSTLISCDFYQGEVGNVYLAALATRNPVAEPVMPEGWEKVAYIEPHVNAATKQYLLVAKHKVAQGEAGHNCTVQFNVTGSQRHYLCVFSIGDSDVSADDAVAEAFVNVRYINPQLHEHTILVCSTSTAANLPATGTSTDQAWAFADGYVEAVRPSYGDGCRPGGRLAAMYIPHLSEQPFTTPQIDVVNADGQTTAGALYCALKLIPGTPARNVCVL